MSRQYHYLVAGFPDLFFDDNKAPLNLKELMDYLTEFVAEPDLEMLKLFFWRYDNDNILAKLKNPEAQLDPLGNLSDDEIDELFKAAVDGSLEQLPFFVPEYLGKLVDAYKNESPIIVGKSWELQFSELYYDFVCSVKNEFISKWYAFERASKNLITAFKCRENNIEPDNHLVGKSELVEKLSRSSARDFGLTDEIPNLEQFLKAVEENDILDQERKIDAIKWNYLDDESFFYYFTIERIFTFLIKLSIVERWMKLDKETGKELFKKLLADLEGSYEFPKDFSLN